VSARGLGSGERTTFGKGLRASFVAPLERPRRRVAGQVAGRPECIAGRLLSIRLPCGWPLAPPRSDFCHIAALTSSSRPGTLIASSRARAMADLRRSPPTSHR